MKKIGLLSDTHSYLDEAVFRHFEKCDEIWHAGDIGNLKVLEDLEAFKPTRAVFGNIDDAKVRRACPENQRFFCEGVDVWITHIGGYPGRYAPIIREQMYKHPPKLFICGHSHILKVVRDPRLGLLHMNPGAIGISGFHKVRTMLRFAIDGDRIQDLDVIEFPRKA
ncbi:metallophosphoesterase family protein [bacterium SCSIO 12741]|nr:metallophosphoesterase family protein [bacterium SCSIO 12741]